MPIATGSQSDLGYMLETNYGVAAVVDATTPYTSIRRKSAAGLNLTKDSYDSEEVRVDRQLADSRHGIRRAGGDVETEISPGSYSDLLMGLLGLDLITNDTPPATNGWFDLSTVTATETGTGIVSSDSIRGGAGHGFKMGDFITLSGSSGSGNNIKYQVTSASTLILTVVPHPVTPTTTDTYTITGFGYRAWTGRTYNSFTIERAYTDIDQYQHFTGMRVNSAAFSLPSTGLASITWNFLGKDSSALQATPVSTAPYATYPYANASLLGVFAAVNGSLTLQGELLATVTDLSFTIDNQLGGSEVVGSNVIPESLWGNTQMVTGKLTALFEDEAIYNHFEQETTAALTFRLDGPTGIAESLGVCFPRCKFNSGNIGDAVATGLPVEMEFRALLPLSSTNNDPSQVIITTSTLAT